MDGNQQSTANPSPPQPIPKNTQQTVPFLGLFLLLVVVPYWMAGLTAEVGNFVRYLFIFFLIINGSASTGYLASSFSPDPVLGLAITRTCMLLCYATGVKL